MGKGKAAAQCCHATLANYKELSKKSPKVNINSTLLFDSVS